VEDLEPSIRFSIAADVGGIELIHGLFHRRGVPPHIHDEYSVSIPLRGGLAFDFRGSKYSAPSGVISCTPPGEVHNAYAARGARWEFICFLIPAAVVSELLEGTSRLPDLPQRVIDDYPMVQHLISLYNQLELEGDPLERQSASNLVFRDFFQRHSTAKCARSHCRIGKRPIQRALELLHECYSDPISLGRLSAHAGLSPYYFLRMFRSAVGITPHVYLNQIRVIEAKRKLANGMTAAQAAQHSGFCDQSHMARQFKRTVFITPGQYQTALKL
jgi:AraC-like DNA-binding protein